MGLTLQKKSMKWMYKGTYLKWSKERIKDWALINRSSVAQEIILNDLNLYLIRVIEKEETDFE